MTTGLCIDTFFWLRTITMTKLENVDPLLTSRDDEDVFFSEAIASDRYALLASRSNALAS